METQPIKSALLNFANDQLEVVEYGHGALVYVPMYYSDDDAVSLFIEPFQSGFRVTDQGSTALRLQMADLNLDSRRISEAWKEAVGNLQAHSMDPMHGELSVWGQSDQIGQMIFGLASASMRVDQLRVLANASKPVPFADRVLGRVQSVLREVKGLKVQPQAKVSLTSGRKRQVTAAIAKSGSGPTIVQAIGGTNKQQREDQVERCFHLFSFAEAPQESRIAVAIGVEQTWDKAMVEEISTVAEVVFFDELHGLERSLERHLHAGIPVG